ncbi:SAM-dependent methyltransferase [Aureimonas leprariae]|uniref:Methyltransferase domain-containing protein n=1 Tax=Plantimonas leprariae TaxID=2615207 RepID=A0A7V7PTA1_9HYPH|nr:SAM-dependent methyltransferase [Aureimonas leprariae]KAB0682930.1 methyltransferase domain-containing protein [Aureimonas leprariae]
MAAAPVKRIDAAGFEVKFRETIDPWNYAASPFEAYKRGVLLRACGSDRRYGRALEFGCAIGETSRFLSPRCLRLLAVDASPTALAEAERRNAGNRRVAFRRSLLPREVPRGRFDLVVLSEVAYYLTKRELAMLMQKVARITAPGGRVVVLHHVRPFGDASQLPALAQARACAALARTMRRVHAASRGRFECAAYLKPR